MRVGKDEIDAAAGVVRMDAAEDAWTACSSAATSSTSGSTKTRRRRSGSGCSIRCRRCRARSVVLDVKSGEVRALVGGYDFQISKFNRAMQSRRQTGSSFKPFVYGAAFEKGLTPADTLFDAPIAIPVGNQIYAPKNYYGKYAGIVTIQRALELSINVPAVKTYMMVGGDHVVDFARRCGITADLPKYPSLALGAAGVSPIEMTAAYNVFANQGVYVKPRFIRRITDQTDKRARGAAAGAVRGDAAAGRVRARVRDARDDRSRHGVRGAHAAAADRREDRHDERLHRRVVHRLLAGVHGRRLGRLRRSAPLPRRRRDRRGGGAADLDRHLQAVRRD